MHARSLHARSFRHLLLVPLAMAAFAGCAETPGLTDPDASMARRIAGNALSAAQCDADNAGLTLPPGFCALVVADLVLDGQPALARHLVVLPSGDIFVAINSPRNRQPSFGIIGLRDRDGDGRADEQSRFSPGLGGSGLTWRDGRLFFGANDRVLRFRLPAGRLTPVGAPEVVVSGLPDTQDHISKTVVLGDHDDLFVGGPRVSGLSRQAVKTPGVLAV